MNKDKLNTLAKQISQHLSQRNIINAFEELGVLIHSTQYSDFKLNYNQQKETYKYLLEYTVKGVDDPKREEVFLHICTEILDLTDKIKFDIEKNILDNFHYEFKSEYLNFESIQLLKITNLFNQLITKGKPIQETSFHSFTLEKSFHEQYQQLLDLYLRKIWLTNTLDESENTLMNDIVISEKYAWFDKSIIVSAITLSLLRYFDIKKFFLLISFYEGKENQVWQRALTGLILCMNAYVDRLELYPSIYQRLSFFNEDPDFERSLHDIMLQIAKSQETEKIVKQIKEEILPEVAKITPKLYDKLDLGNLIKNDLSDEKNPEWEKFMEDSEGLYGKMEELTKMQMDGSDIFMGTFSMLKNFPFFDILSNWFLPFYPEEDTINKEMEKEKEHLEGGKFLETVQKNPYMCNSDKYSFCLNISRIPSAQKSMLLNLISEEFNAMSELADEDKVLKKAETGKFVFTQYIQDLYRFFKLYKKKELFTDIFIQKNNLYSCVKFQELIGNSVKVLKNIGEFYFDRNLYEKAIELFLMILSSNEQNFELLQKIAFCYQKLRKYDVALKYYQKAELFDKNVIWNMKKIAFCYQRLKQPDKALEYYTKAEKLQPDNLQIQVNIGKCYLEKLDYEQALKYFYKVEYLSPDNIKVIRPLSWCSFALGKFDQAAKYLDKVIEAEGNKYDFMNRGHIEFCRANLGGACSYYLKSISQKNNTQQEFLLEFEEDKQYLIGHGIDLITIKYVIDYVLMNVKKQK